MADASAERTYRFIGESMSPMANTTVLKSQHRYWRCAGYIYNYTDAQLKRPQRQSISLTPYSEVSIVVGRSMKVSMKLSTHPKNDLLILSCVDDFEVMLERCKIAGVKSMIITGGSLSDSKEALDLANKHDLTATVGCHPTRSDEFDSYEDGPEMYLEQLDKVIEGHISGKGRVVAVGECGLGIILSNKGVRASY